MRQNTLLVRWRDGYTEVTDAPAVAADRRHEGFLSLQDATSVDVAQATADANLEFSSLDTVAFEVGYENTGGAKPYTDYNPGDTLDVPDPSGALVTDRVVGVTLENDDNGYAVTTIEVNTVLEDPDVRAQRVFKRMTNGTLGGRSRSATPRGALPNRSGAGGGAEPAACGVPGPEPDDPLLTATGDFSCAEGYGSTAQGNISFAIGDTNTTKGSKSICAGGENCETDGPLCATVGGFANVAGNFGGPEESAAVVGGERNLATGNESVVAGGENNTASGMETSVIGGEQNTASGERSIVGGAILGVSAGDNSAVLGGDTNTVDATEPNSGILGGASGLIKNTVDNLQYGHNAIIGGDTNQILDSSINTVIAGGNTNTATDAENSFICGENNQISGSVQDIFMAGNGNLVNDNATAAVALGANGINGSDGTEGGAGSITHGAGAVTWLDKQHAFADSLAASSTPPRAYGQGSYIPFQLELSGAAPPGTLANLPLPDLAHSIAVEATVVVRPTAIVATQSWKILALLSADGAGGFVEVGATITSLFSTASPPGWSITTGFSIIDPATWSIGISGLVGTTTNWSAVLHLVEVLDGGL